ncbi:lysophospholipase L1-like esterase [Paenibacillus sp. V4I3]|uniref:SGNH/GDSL hydrolase family protein n=1 Tax=unclassified Paenibacillus TaxID=185978 RepID=UPI0027845683|nr:MULTISPECIES: SGNH/GDSL hydrolase family protein [unclassified Paenibacillus]MDQ0878592.1 lysophospholipase L1-like esterase [Paenibacillus sp. V4I3]MDQ0885550.1 lysophospholipase L1-like esterase [Paenibacillus sp. V4I9]
MQSKWVGKTWGTLGDSITEAGGYQPLIQSALGFSSVINYGKSGCSMTAGGDRDYGATTHVGKTIDASLDCVTVFAGVNDFRLDKPIGGIGSTDIYTFYGAYTTLIEDILAKNPHCRLSLWTPLQRDKDGYDIFYVNAVGHRLYDYVEAIKQIGRLYALPVLNLYEQSGLNKLTLPLFTSDGLHPNESGHRRIADMAIPFLLSL